MLTNKRILVANYVASAALGARLLAAYGDADDHATAPTGAAGEKLLGAIPAAAGDASIGEALLSGVVGDIGSVLIGR